MRLSLMTLIACASFFNTVDAKEVDREDSSEIKSLEVMDQTQIKTYLMSERHAIKSQCGRWDDVTIITGKKPRIVISGAAEPAREAKWDGVSYSFRFDNGSMSAKFTPSKPSNKLTLQAGFTTYQCDKSEVNHHYDKR